MVEQSFPCMEERTMYVGDTKGKDRQRKILNKKKYRNFKSEVDPDLKKEFIKKVELLTSTSYVHNAILCVLHVCLPHQHTVFLPHQHETC